MSAYTVLGFEGATATAIFPTTCDGGSPCPTRRFQVTPPSRDIHSPLPGPPLCRCHVFTSNCHIPANTVFGSPGSIARSEQPVLASTNSTRVHVLPPSAVRYTPRSCCGPYARPRAHTSTTSGSAGWITIRAIRPVAWRPLCCQLRPPSVERYTPLPSAVVERMKNVSPVPAQRTLCADGASASAPIAWAGWLSNTACQCTPPSSVFQMPPEAAPM